MTFSVLVVCTANICRSPIAERLLARTVGDAPVAVSSAGVRALVGHAMDAASARALAELGGDGTGHVARQAAAPLVAGSDLVLTMTSEHRGTLLRDVPAAFRRTFTLREFGRLGRDLPPLDRPVTEDALRTRVTEVAAQRGRVAPPSAGEDEIGDPFGAPYPVVQASAAQIAAAVAAAAGVLGLTA